MIRNSVRSEENAHLKYISVPCAKYVSADEKPDVFADDKQWEACKAAYKAIKAIAEKTGGRLVPNNLGQTEVETDVSDGKI